MATNSQETKSPESRKSPNPLTATRKGLYADELSQFAVTIGKPPEVVYAFWRDLTNLPMFMKDLKEVRVLSPKKSHWVVEMENGLRAEWDAEITAETPNETISWKSVEGSEVETAGSVYFRPAPAGQGTVVSLSLDYKIPGGKLTELLTLMSGEHPEILAFTNLRRLKCFLETGELATTKGQSSGREEDLEPQTKH